MEIIGKPVPKLAVKEVPGPNWPFMSGKTRRELDEVDEQQAVARHMARDLVFD